jgi:hypothetical protein
MISVHVRRRPSCRRRLPRSTRQVGQQSSVSQCTELLAEFLPISDAKVSFAVTVLHRGTYAMMHWCDNRHAGGVAACLGVSVIRTVRRARNSRVVGREPADPQCIPDRAGRQARRSRGPSYNAGAATRGSGETVRFRPRKAPANRLTAEASIGSGGEELRRRTGGGSFGYVIYVRPEQYSLAVAALGL